MTTTRVFKSGNSKVSKMSSRLVYSTETGSICRKCGKPAAACRCKKKKPATPNKPPSGCPDDGIVRIRREVKGRKGKTATIIVGIPLDNNELKKFTKELKQRCGASGSIKDGAIIPGFCTSRRLSYAPTAGFHCAQQGV